MLKVEELGFNRPGSFGCEDFCTSIYCRMVISEEESQKLYAVWEVKQNEQRNRWIYEFDSCR